MKAQESQLLPFLDGKKQFIIPIYQRTYSWTHEQCEQLWHDILRVATDNTVTAHFLGSVVYIQNGTISIGGIPCWLIIDGQQRLTTLTLLLIALARVAQEQNSPAISAEDIYDSYVINKHGKDEQHYKLLLTQSDKETLLQLIEHPEKAYTTKLTGRLVDNYRYFEEQLRKSGTDLSLVYTGISKLIIVDISLNKDHDNPQLIFESLNSTGQDLSKADLIRNYILMGLDSEQQTRLYKDYWYPIEQNFRYSNEANQFDRFMRDYLTLKQGSIPNIEKVYASFKAYHLDNITCSMQEIVADIARYAQYFANMAFLQEEDREIKRIMYDINSLKIDVAYPFFLELYNDYMNDELSRVDFIAILKFVESYIFRRSICGIATNVLNKIFAALYKEVDKANYLKSVQVALLSKSGSGRFPRNDEFRAAFVVKDVYTYPRRNYLLRKLESYGRKERVYVEGYTIEHIMPQNKKLSAAWKQELGPDWEEVQARYLHTIGNLTLTGYNSELSDRPFQEKRDMEGGFAHSPIRLNWSLGKLEHWNKDEIEKRATDLAELAITIWSIPALPSEGTYANSIVGNNNKAYSLQDYPALQGTMLTLFEQLRKQILNLDVSVREEYKKLYIAYKTITNFVDVEPQKKRLRISLNMPFNEIDDPKGLCRDLTGIGHFGNGDVEVSLTSLDQIEDVMDLIRQSFERYTDA